MSYDKLKLAEADTRVFTHMHSSQHDVPFFSNASKVLAALEAPCPLALGARVRVQEVMT